MLQIVVGLWALIRTIPDLVGIIRALMQMAQEYKLAEDKRKFIKEVKEAVKESARTYDNTRLVNILNPTAEPLPRGVFNETDPKV